MIRQHKIHLGTRHHVTAYPFMPSRLFRSFLARCQLEIAEMSG